jgi:hypothetical protein
MFSHRYKTSRCFELSSAGGDLAAADLASAAEATIDAVHKGQAAVSLLYSQLHRGSAHQPGPAGIFFGNGKWKAWGLRER